MAYLLQFDPFTGLIKNEPEHDGWMAIEAFRDLVNAEGYGIKALTCVCLVMDYGSPIKQYSEKERPAKAMEMVYYNRSAILWNSDEIQFACIQYKELQYDAALEEKKMLEDLRRDKLDQIGSETEESKKKYLLKELNDINVMVDNFEKKNSGKDLFYKSPVRNGYALQRLEIKLTDKKSFYHDREKAREREQRRQQEADAAAKGEATAGTS